MVSCSRRLGRAMETLVFYFICIEMVVTQNYGLIWMEFSERIRAGISKYKDGKVSWSVLKSYCQILV